MYAINDTISIMLIGELRTAHIISKILSILIISIFGKISGSLYIIISGRAADVQQNSIIKFHIVYLSLPIPRKCLKVEALPRIGTGMEAQVLKT